MRALVTFAFLFFFSSAFAQNAQEDRKYFPCQPGMKWVYNNDSTSLQTVEVKKVTGSEIIIQTKTYLKSDKKPIVEVYAFSRNMLLKTKSSEGTVGTENLKYLTPSEIILKFPVEVGDCWSLNLEKGIVERKIKKKHASFTIKDKTYKDVIEVEERSENEKKKYFYCKNIGLVQISVPDSADQFIPLMTLNSFNK